MFSVSDFNIYKITENAIIKIKSLLTLDNIIMFCKIIAIYLLTFAIFYTIEKKCLRLIFASIIYILCLYTFNIKFNIALFYIFIAIGCVITESIYITFCKDTWNYRNPDIINIPYWLIPLWSIAFLLIIQTVNIVK